MDTRFAGLIPPVVTPFTTDGDLDLDSLDRVLDHLIDGGVAPEQARMILPQNMMTEWYWTGSLMFFARVCAQRLDPHAQAETSEVARQIADIVRPLFPVSWAALTAKEEV